MDATVNFEPGRATLALSGRFDFNAHRMFREASESAVNQPEVREIHLDLGRVSYIDSSALGMLLMLRDKARTAHKGVRIANCAVSVREVLEIANCNKLFSMV